MKFESISRNWKRLPHPLRWFASAVVGLTLVVLGIVFLVLPGPGIPLIIAGLALLATEFAWAEILLNKTKTRWQLVLDKTKDKFKKD